MMAPEAVDVMSSFCADERIVALGGLANNTLDEFVKRSATKRAEQIIISQSFFGGAKNN